jgi:uncharacterized protein (TIGR02996 family)
MKLIRFYFEVLEMSPTDDAAFLRSVLASPNDDTVRLVYADWLEEQNDPRAEFLRLENQLLQLPAKKQKSAKIYSRLEELHRTLDPDWVALIRRVPMMDVIEVCLSDLEKELPGLNYVVGFHISRVPIVPDTKPEGYITTALGPKVKVRHLVSVSGEDLLTEVEGCLKYRGASGSHGPERSSLKSAPVKNAIARVMNYLRESVHSATRIARIHYAHGVYPGFHPIFWGFDYLLVKPQCAVVFIGASSD